MTNDSENLYEKIRNWMIEDDYIIEELSEEGLTWFFVAKDEEGKGCAVSQRAGKQDEIYIRAAMEFDKPTRDGLAKMKPAKRNSFYSEVRFGLLSLDVEFMPEGEPIWKKLTISRRIFADALTKDEFIWRVFQVHKAMVAVAWILNDSFPDSSPEQAINQNKGSAIH